MNLIKKEVTMAKKLLKIGYLPIIDHLVLGISKERDNSRLTHTNLKPIRFHEWDEIADALSKGDVDGAFIMAPLAMSLKSKGVPIKTVLLGHREGLGLVVNKDIKKPKQLEGKVIGVPHKISTHVILLDTYLKKKKVNLYKIKIKPLPPPEFVHNLASKKISAYLGSEPFGVQAEHQFVGKVEVMSQDIKKHHIDCILVLRDDVFKNPLIVEELVNSLVSSGTFMHDNPAQASKIGAQFLEQSQAVLKDTLNEKKMRVTAWDLLPIKKEFEEMQKSAINLHMYGKKIEMDKFVVDDFAKKAYELQTLKKGKKQRRKITKEKIILPAIVLVAAIALWHLIAISGLFKASMLPAPLVVLKGTLEVAKQGMLSKHIFASLYRVFAGFFLAAFFAIPLGLLLGAYQKSKYAFDPLIQILRPISPIAWIPLAILWFGIGDKPAIFIIFITAFFPMLLAANSAVKNIDPVLIKAAVNFGTKNKDMLMKVILPAAFPNIMVGIRISLGISWVIIVAAEMVGMSSGLGYMILDARNFLRTDLIVSGMIIIGLIGLVLDRILNYFEAKVKARWSFKEVQGV